CQQCNTDPRTF
nr:immunoglobulin light chain junction region [Macaca mulatta]